MPRLITVSTVRRDLEDIERSGCLTGPPSEWGPRIWRVLHNTIELVPCESCRDHGRVAMEGLHDLVNVAKREVPERPESLCELVELATRAANTSGRCPVVPPGARFE